MEFKEKLPTPIELKKRFPVSEEIKKIKSDRDDQIIDIFTGKDDRFLMIIGPCSADNEEAVLEYMRRLRTLQEIGRASCRERV